MRSFAALTATLFILALSDATLADDSSAEMRTVRLKNGAAYRGELVELEPNDHITIKLATGEVKRFEWSSIAPPTKPRTEEAPSPPAERPPSLIDDRGVLVTLNSDDPAALLYALAPDARSAQGNDAWQFICATPCNVKANPTLQFRIQGEGIMTSRPFFLPPLKRATVQVDTGSRGRTIAGWILFGLGATLFASGLLALASKDCEFGDALVLAPVSIGVPLTFVGLGLTDQTDVDLVRSSLSGASFRVAGPIRLTPNGLVF